MDGCEAEDRHHDYQLLTAFLYNNKSLARVQEHRLGEFSPANSG